MATIEKMDKMVIVETVLECDKKFGTNLSFEVDNTDMRGNPVARIFDDNVEIRFLFDGEDLELEDFWVHVTTSWGVVPFDPTSVGEDGNLKFSVSSLFDPLDPDMVVEAEKFLENSSGWVNHILL